MFDGPAGMGTTLVFIGAGEDESWGGEFKWGLS